VSLGSVTELHVEDVPALAARVVAGRLNGADGSRRDAVAVDHPCARLDAVRHQQLHLGRGGGMPVHDIALREGRSADEAETQGDGGGDEGLRHGLAPVASAVADEGTMAVDEAERAEVLQGPVGGAAPGASARTAPGSSKRGRQSAGLGPAVCR